MIAAIRKRNRKNRGTGCADCDVVSARSTKARVVAYLFEDTRDPFMYSELIRTGTFPHGHIAIPDSASPGLVAIAP